MADVGRLTQKYILFKHKCLSPVITNNVFFTTKVHERRKNGTFVNLCGTGCLLG
jgi:hypothetical protein